MRLLSLKTKQSLVSEIQDLKEEVLCLKKKLKIQTFISENAELLNKYPIGYHITADVIIVEHKFYIEFIREGESPSGFLSWFKWLFKSPKVDKVTFKVECLDLKSKAKLILDIEEAKQLTE